MINSEYNKGGFERCTFTKHYVSCPLQSSNEYALRIRRIYVFDDEDCTYVFDDEDCTYVFDTANGAAAPLAGAATNVIVVGPV